MNKLRFVRSADGALTGVCSGLAKAFDIEVWIMRLVWLISVLWFGTGVFLYLILSITLPREDRLEQVQKRILGVCWRVSQRFNLEIGIVRTAALLLLLVSFGSMILIYVGAYFLMPHDGKSQVQ